MTRSQRIFKTYHLPILLVCALLLGACFGYFYPQKTKMIAPLGDLFLNLIFCIIVPLIFFSIAKAFAQLKSHQEIAKIFKKIIWVFLVTGLIAAILSYVMLCVFPIDAVKISGIPMAEVKHFSFLEKVVELITVSQFSDLLSHQHMLALMIFSGLVGISGGAPLLGFLEPGEAICMKVFSYIMYYAPIGFFAYFANMVAQLGPQVISQYTKVAFTYYLFAIFYFIVVYSLYAYYARGKSGVLIFWKYITLPATTALATCSSAASIPANFEAAKNMNIQAEVYESCIPLGTFIHKDGSVIGGMFKIAFLMMAFHMNFSDIGWVLLAIMISLLVGTVMGAIPSGGMLGELLILSVYGFPNTALVSIAAISIIIDPVASLLNTAGNTIACMLVDKKWIQEKS
jgi:Na+/H+-dicarboxylate symporter